MKKVISQFSHFCVETGEVISAKATCYYDEVKGVYYHLKAEAVRLFLTAPDTDSGLLQANEEVQR